MMSLATQKGKDKAKAGLVVFYNPFEAGGNNAAGVLAESVSFLKDARFTVIPSPVMVHDIPTARQAAHYFREAGLQAIIIHLATWTGDDLLVEFVSWLDRCVVILWALRDMNSGSFCGCQQFNMVLCELHVAIGNSVIGRDANTMKKLNMLVPSACSQDFFRPDPSHDPDEEAVRSTVDALRRVRVGIIGARTPGMMEVAFDEFGIKQRIGPIVCSIAVADLERKVTRIPRDSVEAAIATFKDKFRGVGTIATPAAIEVGVRNYLALKDIIKEHYLDAVTLDCYPGYMGKACIAFSMLADEGIPCACEADVHAAILMWLVQRLSNLPVNHIDTLDMDPEGNTLTGGHCGSCSLQLAVPGSAVVAPVRLANDGACVMFPQKVGPVTLVNLVGHSRTFRVCVLTGSAIDAGLVFPGNPVTIKLDARVNKVLETIDQNGLGHHWIVGQGTHYASILVNLFQTLGIKVYHVK